jgi:hypothetical protein
VFAGHAEQLTLAILEQLDAPANEYKPAAHVEQFPRLDAPSTLEDVPTGQCVHALTPDPFEYVPTGQPVHTLAPVAPENMPPGQLVHAALPMPPLYCPVGQPVQGPPFGPVYPALHDHTLSPHVVPKFSVHKNGSIPVFM